ncbi:MAG: hypothetical protein M1814_000617 [Vezdaea aestivalis]|nr:MAG: hypothetical protein M1814_000617 [Vezdaea aestivalis]
MSSAEVIEQLRRELAQAKEDKKQAEERANQAEERVNQAKQNTTLHEYIEACHTYFSTGISIQEDKYCLKPKSRRVSTYQSKLLDLLLSSRVTRSQTSMNRLEQFRPELESARPDDLPSNPDGEFRGRETPFSTRGTRGTSSESSRETSPADRSIEGGENWPYCTQACLLGLRQGEKLDQNCPNISLHRNEKDRNESHLIDRKTLLNLLRDQLGEDLDDYCHDLGIRGARGALFRVSLRSYGYTMVAKGTVAASVRYLRHEYRVYKRLRALQGACVPVCLGNIDLINPYYYLPDIDIIYMMFLAWVGEPSKVVGDGRVEE